MFGLTFEKLLLVAVIAAFLIGPTRLPAYASKLASLVKAGRRYLDAAQDRAREELGMDIDWKSLDPRQYDPRQIIRNALTGDDETPPLVRRTASAIRSEEQPADRPPMVISSTNTTPEPPEGKV